MKRQSIFIVSILSLFVLAWWTGYSLLGSIDWSAKKAEPTPSSNAQVSAPQTPQRAQDRRAPAANAQTSEDRQFASAGWRIDSTNDTPKACLNFTAAINPDDNIKVLDYIRTEPEAKLTAEITGEMICLTGFDYSKDYSLTILAGLNSAEHGALEGDTVLDISFGDRPPFVSFAGNGVILPRIGAQGLAIETVNISELNVTIYRVGDRIMARRSPAAGEATAEGRYSYQYRDAATEVREEIWSGTLPVENVQNALVTTVLPINELIGTLEPGAYVVEAIRKHEDDEYRVAQAWRWIISTDLALTTYKSASGLDVTVRSIDSAQPVKNTRIDLVAYNNEVLDTLVTDSNGRVHFGEKAMNGAGPVSPRMLMAYGKAGDYAMLDFNRSPLDLSAFPIGGRASAKAIDAYVFPDRGIYRPGETVHLTVMLRDQLGTSVMGRKGQIRILKPNRQEFRKVRFDESLAGTLLQDFTMPASAPRGVWRAVVEIDGMGQVGAADFSVEDFVPQKLRVDVKIDDSPMRPDELRTIDVVAQFLYGADGKGLDAEAEMRLRVDPKPFPALKGYYFGRADKDFREVYTEIGGGVTDDKGVLSLEFKLPIDEYDQLNTSSPLRAEITVGAAEPGGRYIKNSARIPVRTQDVYIGIKPDFDGRAPRNKPANFNIKAVDWQGAPISVKGAKWVLVEEDWHYNWYRDHGEWRYRYEIRDIEKARGHFDIDGVLGADLTRVMNWGTYRLMVEDARGNYAMAYRFSVGWGGSTTSDAPDQIKLGAPELAARSGGNAVLSVKAPYAGYGELVIASDKIHTVRSVKIPAGGSDIKIKLDSSWGAGVYALLTVYTPRTIDERPVPRRAVGVTYIPMDVSARKLGVSLSAPDVTKPRRKQNITVKVDNVPRGETVWLTLAAIDEGVLQVTKYKSPDPENFYFGKKSLRVDVRDDYARLLNPNLGAAAIANSGGDSLGGEGLTATPIKVVSLYSGPVKLKGGKAVIPVQLPDFNGEIRLMAVAWSESAVGSASQPMKVRDAVPTILAMPRFLAPGDSAVLTASLDNVDGKSGNYGFKLKQEGDLVIEDGSAKISLSQGERKTVTSRIFTSQTGVNSVSMNVRGPGGFNITSSFDIQTRSPFMPITRVSSARLAPGEKFIADQSYMEGFDPGSTDITVSFARTPGLDPSAYAASVSSYPYGCTEQTVSRALPLLYANDIGGSAGIGKGEARIALQAAVDKIINRQDNAGAFGLWSVQDGHASPWVGVYAADFIQRASEQDYIISDTAMESTYSALKTITKMERYPGLNYHWYYDNDKRTVRTRIHAEAAAYAHYVLARAGRGELRSMRYFYDHHADKMKSPLAWGHIGAALAMMDDKKRSNTAFDKGLSLLGYDNDTDYYQSPLRDTAGFLAVATEANASHVLAETQQAFSDSVKPPNRLHTQEKAQTILAIRAMLLGSEPVNITAKNANLTISKGLASAHLYGTELYRSPSFTNKSNGDVWRTVMVTGAPLKAPLPRAKGYTLEKTIYTMDGEKADITNVAQGAQFIVKVSFTPKSYRRRQTVLADLLPAGMEIERLLTPEDAERQHRWHDQDDSAGPFAFLGELSAAQTKEKRDDRVVIATETRGKRTYTYAYIVRAVTPGDFIWPGAVVEDMYRPQDVAITPAARVIITADQRG